MLAAKSGEHFYFLVQINLFDIDDVVFWFRRLINEGVCHRSFAAVLLPSHGLTYKRAEPAAKKVFSRVREMACAVITP